MSGEREVFLNEIRAAAEAGARSALDEERKRCEACANFAEIGSKEATAHTEDHRQLRRFYIPFVRKTEDRAVSLISMAFWLVIALVIILLFTEVRPFAGLIFPTSQNGVK